MGRGQPRRQGVADRPADRLSAVYPCGQRANCSRTYRRRRAGHGAAIACRPWRWHPHADRAAIHARPIHRHRRRLHGSHLADAERDQRRAGRLPARRRVGLATPLSPILRGDSPRRSTPAEPMFSTSALASGTPTGYQSSRKTSVVRSNASSASTPTLPPITAASSAHTCASKAQVHAILRAGSSPATGRTRSPSTSPHRTRSFSTSSPSPSLTRYLQERRTTRSDRPSSPQQAPI